MVDKWEREEVQKDSGAGSPGGQYREIMLKFGGRMKIISNNYSYYWNKNLGNKIFPRRGWDIKEYGNAELEEEEQN